jgi:hypothetical protein
MRTIELLRSPPVSRPKVRLSKSSRELGTRTIRSRTHINIRQLLLDVDKAVVRPSLLEIAAAIDKCIGVEAVNITVEEIDIETVGMNVTIEGDGMDYEAITRRSNPPAPLCIASIISP